VITLRTGAPGNGKSYGAMRLILGALERGQWVATNIELREGWALTMAKLNIVRRLVPGRVRRTAEDFERRLYVTHSLDEFTRLRLPPCGRCDGCRRSGRCRKESRGVMVLDEAHNWLNARTWDADESGESVTRAEAVQKRQRVNRLFSQHRKLGWDMFLIAQDAADIDKQVRNKFEYRTHLKNMKRWRPFGIPLFPFNLFVENTFWNDTAGSRVSVKTYGLSKRLAQCYDTMATSHGLDWDDPTAIYLGAAVGPATADDDDAETGPAAARSEPEAARASSDPWSSLTGPGLDVEPGSA